MNVHLRRSTDNACRRLRTGRYSLRHAPVGARLRTSLTHKCAHLRVIHPQETRLTTSLTNTRSHLRHSPTCIPAYVTQRQAPAADVTSRTCALEANLVVVAVVRTTWLIIVVADQTCRVTLEPGNNTSHDHSTVSCETVPYMYVHGEGGDKREDHLVSCQIDFG